MWKNLSLRMRLVLPLGTIFVAALLLGGISLQIFASGQLMEENEPASRSAKAVAEALNSALLMSTNPHQTLDAFVASLGTSEATFPARRSERIGAFGGRGPNVAWARAAVVRRSARPARSQRVVSGDDRREAGRGNRIFT